MLLHLFHCSACNNYCITTRSNNDSHSDVLNINQLFQILSPPFSKSLLSNNNRLLHVSPPLSSLSFSSSPFRLNFFSEHYIFLLNVLRTVNPPIIAILFIVVMGHHQYLLQPLIRDALYHHSPSFLLHPRTRRTPPTFLAHHNNGSLFVFQVLV